MTNTTICFLLALKNAAMSRKEVITITYNKLNLELIVLLYNEGFLQTYKTNIKLNSITIFLRYGNNKNIFKDLKIFSTPSRLIYVKYSDLCKISDKKVLLVFSTDKGFFTSLDCKKNKIGGKFLFMC